MAKGVCDLKYFKYFAPARMPSNLSSKQLNAIANMTDERATKYLSSRDYLDDDTVRALEGLASIAPQRFARTTNKGRPTTEVLEEARQAAERLAKETSDDVGYLQDAGEAIALNFRKGNPMSIEERALVYPAFANRMDNLPLLLRQIQHAKQTGNDKAASVLGLEMVKTMGVAAGVFGDKNAVSVALNSMKYLNRQIQQAKTIERLFQNGEC
jgi:hypothetical protein